MINLIKISWRTVFMHIKGEYKFGVRGTFYRAADYLFVASCYAIVAVEISIGVALVVML